MNWSEQCDGAEGTEVVGASRFPRFVGAVPNQALQQTGHANDVSAWRHASPRVSRLLSLVFGLKGESMPVRLFIAWSLFIPCAATIGCVPSAEPEVDKGTRTTLKVLAPPRRVAEGEADKKKAAEEKAAEKKVVKEKVTVNGYVKVKVEVELCGLLSCAEGAITISTDEKHHWTLDFGEDKETRTRAKNLEGKTVLVKGMAILHGIRKPEIPRERGIRDYRRDTISPRILSQQAVQLSSEVVAKSLVLAPED